jgi:PHD/YefM family antitoxin component YafN of YafNO toxin-antitoxin module
MSNDSTESLPTSYESIQETLEIMSDPELMAALRQGIEQASTGQTIAWDQIT